MGRHPTDIYGRAETSQVAAVQSVLATTAGAYDGTFVG